MDDARKHDQCTHDCPGGHACILVCRVPHRAHICSLPDCWCHTAERYECEKQTDALGMLMMIRAEVEP